MLQLTTCVSVECDKCGATPDGGNARTSWGSEARGAVVAGAVLRVTAAALETVAALGWRLMDGQLLCPDCVAVRMCEATGHEFTVWYRTRSCGCARGPGGHPGGPSGCGLEFRYCTRCGRDESRYALRDTGCAARVAAIPVVCQLGAAGRGKNAGLRRGTAVAVVDPEAVA